MTIGVVIPCRNEAHRIADVLDALADQDRQPDRVVVVDDGSTDGTAEVVRRWTRHREVPRSQGPEVQGSGSTMPVVVIHGPGRGVAAAVNAGIAALDTDVIVRLDGHCRPARDYIRRTAALSADPGIGVAGGAWTIEPGAGTLEARGIAIAVGHPLGSGGAEYRKQGSGEAGKPATLLPSVDTVPFGCFRRRVWEELGGLDEALWSNEDYDFNFRVRRRALRVVLDPSIRCTYYARPSLTMLSRQYFRYGWWKARMLMRHPGSIRWRQLVPAMLVPVLLVCAVGLMVRSKPLWPLVLAAYVCTILLAALHAGLTRRAPQATLWIALAFFTVQVMWSAGFWASVLSGAASSGSSRTMSSGTSRTGLS